MIRPIPPEIAGMLDTHQQWLESGGHRGQQFQLIEADLSHLDLSDRLLVDAIIPGCNFAFSLLRNTDFTYANVASCHFADVDLTGASFTKGNLSYARFVRAAMPFAKLLRAECWETEFAEVVLTDADMRYGGLLESKLIRTDLRRSQMEGVALNNTTLQSVDWRGVQGIEQIQAVSATIVVEGEALRLEGEALREWLVAAAIAP